MANRNTTKLKSAIATQQRPASMPHVSSFDERNEVLVALEPKVREEMFASLRPDRPWTPPDVLPASDDPDALRAFRKSEENVSDALLICFIAHTATEENLPHYLARLNMYPGMRDETGTDKHGWAMSAREWTAQEYVHGLSMMAYLDRLGKRVNIPAIVQTNQAIIRNGFNMAVEDPYEFFIYTTIQEDLTKVAHGRTANVARKEGGEFMAKLCSSIVGDEARHHRYYRAICAEFIAIDPNGFMLALENKLKKYVFMPTRTIDDGRGSTYALPKTFIEIGRIERATGVFTEKSYADTVAAAIDFWGIGKLRLTGGAARAQEKVMTSVAAAVKKADEEENKSRELPSLAAFPWLNQRVA